MRYRNLEPRNPNAPGRSVKPIQCLARCAGLAGLVATLCGTAGWAADTTPANESASYPSCFTENVDGASRFGDPLYSRWLAGEGLRGADPQAIFARSKAAYEGGELYKAYYLSRVVNAVAPDVTAAWANTATIAEALGLKADADAYRARAEGQSTASLPNGLLPGTRLGIRPSTLADWGAAVSLLADGIGGAEGPEALISLVDSVSGIQPMSYVDKLDGQVHQFAIPMPIQLDHVLSNTFSLRDARAMSKKGMGFGNWMSLVAGAALAYGTGSNAPYMNPASVASANQLAADALSRAFAVTSEWQKGSYLTRNYAEGKAQDVKLEPKTAGRFDAVNLPVPLLIGSGGSLRPSIRARLGDGGGSPAKAYAVRYAPDDKPDKYIKKSKFRGQEYVEDKRWKEYRIPDLAFPRLATLYFTQKREEPGDLPHLVPNHALPHISVTALEIALIPEDLEAFIADATSRAAVIQQMPRLEAMRDAYRNGDPRLSLGYENGFARRAGMSEPTPSLVGFDPTGICYAITGRIDPGAWLMRASTSR